MKRACSGKLGVAAAALLLAAGCTARPAEVRVGLITMLSGENAANGRDMRDAALLAVGDVNARGGIAAGGGRRRITLIVEDDHGSPDASVEAARKLIFKDRVTAIVGPQFSANAIPVARVADNAKVVMIAPMSTNPATTAGMSYVFRITCLDTFQGRVIARFARENLKARSAALLYDVADSYNSTLASVFADAFRASGGVVADSETYTTDHREDFRPQLARVAALHPDVVFLPNYTADVLLQARQARALGITAPLLGGDGWDPHLFATDPSFEGCFATLHWHPTLQGKAREFAQLFSARYGRTPENVAATTWDAFGVLFAAMENAPGQAPGDIRSSLAGLEGFQGATGPIHYEGSGDPVKSLVVIQIKNKAEIVYAVVSQ